MDRDVIFFSFCKLEEQAGKEGGRNECSSDGGSCYGWRVLESSPFLPHCA